MVYLMSISYKLFINTTSSVNLVDSNPDDYKYYVNWSSFLPREHSKYRVTFTYSRSITTPSINGNVFSIIATLGTSSATDQSYTGTDILGSYIPNNYINNNSGNVTVRHKTREFDNKTKVINYPTSNYIRIAFKNETTNTMVPNLNNSALLFFNFQPIIENKKKKLPRFRRKRRY